MKRILPYYKNECLSPSGIGYSSMKSALKYMKISKQLIDDFKTTLPENYWDEYSYVYKLENPWSIEYKRGDYGIQESGGRFYTTFFTKGDTLNEKLFFDSLPVNDIKKFKVANSTEDENKYRELLFKLLSLGYYPTLFKDEKDYNRRLNKFIKDNVEFREVEIKVEEINNKI